MAAQVDLTTAGVMKEVERQSSGYNMAAQADLSNLPASLVWWLANGMDTAATTSKNRNVENITIFRLFLEWFSGCIFSMDGEIGI